MAKCRQITNRYEPEYIDRVSKLFYEATKSHDIELMNRLLDFFPDVNSQRNYNGKTALHTAVRNGNVEAVKFLLQNGADPSRLDNDDSTPLHLALFKEHVDVLSILIKSDATLLDTQDSKQRTLLWHASRKGMTEMVKFLLESGADPNVVSIDGMAAFNAAIYHGHINVTKVYLNLLGVDLNSPQSDSFHPLSMAARADRVDMGEFLFGQGAKFTQAKRGNETLLHEAVLHNSTNFINFLFKSDLDLSKSLDWKAFQTACNLGHIEALKIIHSKQDININEEPYSTDFLTALQLGHLDIAEYFLRNGAILKGRNDIFPSTTAIKDPKLKIIKLLVKHIPRSQVLEADALHWAAFNGNIDLVKYLVESYNISVNVVSRELDGATPFIVAAGEGLIDIVEYFMKNGADLNQGDDQNVTPLQSASNKGHLDVVKVLLENGVDIESRDNVTQSTALHKAAVNGHVEIVELLLDNGHSIDPKNYNSETPLRTAAKIGVFSTVEVLIDRGANIHFLDANDNRTLLHYCCEFYGGLECVKKVIDLGLNPERRQSNDWTALYGALYSNQNDVVKFLVEEAKVDIEAVTYYSSCPIKNVTAALAFLSNLQGDSICLRRKKCNLVL